MKIGRFLILGVLLVSMGQSLYYWPRLPAKVASHFGMDGQANGWQSKEAFFVVNFVVVIGLASVFCGIMPLVRRLPPFMINLPHKDYWLAPERNADTLAFLQHQLELIGASALLLVVAIMQMAMKANLNGAVALPPALPQALILPLICGFIIFEMTCIVRILTRFSTRPKE